MYPRLSFIRQLQEQGSVGLLFRSILPKGMPSLIVFRSSVNTIIFILFVQPTGIFLVAVLLAC
jgi:hypothetical protein